MESDEEKSGLCPPIAYWDANTDYLSAFLRTLANQRAHGAHPALASWGEGHTAQCSAESSSVIDAPERIKRFMAVSNLVKLLTT